MPPKTSGKAAAKSGKATKAVTKGDKKKRKGKRKESYAIYIYKVVILPVVTDSPSSLGVEASPPGHRCLLQSHVHNELLRE